MSSLTLFIIRHAEKPAEGFPGHGFTEAGEDDDKSLVIRGWQRAGSWATLFGSGRGGDDYPTPSFIYAATPGDQANHGPSRRPAETVSPLAAKLGLQVNSMYGQGAEGQLMGEVLGLSGNVLICWEHHAIIGGILPAIPSVSGRMPQKWNGDRFDVVLRLMATRARGRSPSANSILACSTVTWRWISDEVMSAFAWGRLRRLSTSSTRSTDQRPNRRIAYPLPCNP